jgi:hypothetical protein
MEHLLDPWQICNDVIITDHGDHATVQGRRIDNWLIIASSCGYLH